MYKPVREAQIPEIWETGEDKYRSVSGLKNFYFVWALNQFRGKNFKNKSINQNISVTRGGLSEWKTKTKSTNSAAELEPAVRRGMYPSHTINNLALMAKLVP
jgi:hypothetical protein